MNRTVARGALMAACLTGLMVAVAGCPPRSTSRVVRGTAARLRILYDKPVYEADNDLENAPPPQLGGPYDPGPASSTAWRETPELPKAIDKMSNAELYAFLRGLVYDMQPPNGDSKLVPCEDPGGGACNANVTLYVQPEIGMTGGPGGGGISYDRIVKSNSGFVVARIINYDKRGKQDGKYHIPSATQAWWVVDAPGGTPRSRILVREYPAGGRTPTFRFTRTLKFHKCKHGPSQDTNRPAIAKWFTCEQSEHFTFATAPRRRTGTPRFAAFGSHSFLLQSLMLEATDTTRVEGGEIWITCLAGCCVAR